MRVFTVIWFLAIVTSATAQHVSPLGRFAIDYDRGCSPLTVQITELDFTADIENVSYIYEEGIESRETQYSYLNPGEYRIIQIVGADVTPKTDTLFFSLFEALAPNYDLFYCSDTEFTITNSDSYYDYLQVKLDNEDSVILNPNESNTFTLSGSSGQINIKGFFSNAYTNCNEQSEIVTPQSITSTSVNQMLLASECLNEMFIEVSGSDFNPNHLYEVAYSRGGSAFTSVFIGGIDQPTNYYEVDESLIGDNVCIRLNTLNSCDSTTLFFEERCLVAEILTSINDSYASYSGSDILISSGNVFGLLELGQSLTDEYAVISEFNNQTLTRPISNFRQTNYKITQIDSCGNRFDSVYVSPPFLTLTDKKLQSNSISISATRPVNNLGMASDSILLYNVDSSTVINIPYQEQFNVPSNIGESIRMRLSYSYGNETTIYSNEVQTDVSIQIYVPDAFTPNGDGLNDNLIIFGLPTQNFQFSIYDRWGNIIHQSDQNPVWDGKDGKERVTEGNYLYKLSFELQNGELKSQVGTFTILRN